MSDQHKTSLNFASCNLLEKSLTENGATFTESLNKYMGILPKNFKKFHRFIVYITVMFKALSLLVY